LPKILKPQQNNIAQVVMQVSAGWVVFNLLDMAETLFSQKN
jgi:hypothetical protein